MHHLVELPIDAAPDIVSAQMWALGAVGIEERQDSLVVAFTDDAQAHYVAQRFEGRVRTVGDSEGLDGWREHATTHLAGPFRIRPPWSEAGDGIDLVIDAGHTFGSGSHPSTRLALALIAAEVTPADHIIDVGSGSGILSIGAALRGATAVGFDVDPAARPAAVSNASHNGVSDRVEFRLGPPEVGAGTYDLAVVNVTIDVHETIAPVLGHHIAAPRMVVSGILVGSQESRCADAYQRKVSTRVAEGEWAALVLEP